jgi:hypothetical protein
MFACASDPNLDEFCFIGYVYIMVFRRYLPPTVESSLFGALPGHISLYDSVNALFKVTAPTLGLYESQLLPHSLRGAATAHIRESGGLETDAKLTTLEE